MRLLPNRLGPKLNLSLLVFLLLLGSATAFLVYVGFSSSQHDATRRSSDALETQAKQTLGILAQTQADFGASQLEATAGLGQQASHYFVDASTTNSAPAFDPARLTRIANGQFTDPDPKRVSSVMVPASVPITDAVLRDARDSAALDTLFPAILAGFTGGTRSPNFEADAVYFNSVTGFTRYYPPIPPTQFPADADPRNMVALAGPDQNPAHQTLWTQPSSDETGRGAVITALIPIYERDEYRGVIGMDVPLDRLAAQVDRLKPTPNGYGFYLDQRGQLFNTDSAPTIHAALDDANNTAFASVASAMRAGRTDVLRAELGGEEVFVAFAPVGGIGGSLGLVTPISDVTEQAQLVSSGINDQGNKTVAFVLSTMIGFFFVALVAAAWLNRRLFLSPIETLVDATRAVAAGDYKTRLPVRSNDELGLLAESFNGMTAQLERSRGELETRNVELQSEVAERRRIADELIEREEQYRSVFQATTDGLIISTLDGRIIEINDATARMHGYTREEFLALPPGGHVHPDSRGLREQYFSDLRQGGSYRGRATNVRKDGSTFPVDFHGTRFTYHGAPHGLGVIRDISDQVAAERALAHRASISALGAEVGAALTSALPLRDALQRCTETVVHHLDAVQARIWTLDRQMVVFELQASAGLEPGIDDEFRRVPVLPDDVANRPMVIDDMLTDARLNSIDRGRARRDGLVAMARYPLVVDADIVGLMVVFTREPLTELTLDALPSIAGALAVAIKRDEAEHEVREARQMLEQRVVERTRELSALLDVSHTVASTLDLKRLLGLILDQLQTVAGYTGCSVLTVDGDTMMITDSRGPFAEETAATVGVRFPLDTMRPFWDQMLRGETVSIGDVRGDSASARDYRSIVGDLAETSGFSFVRSLLIVPLGWKDSVIGMLTMSHEIPDYYDEPHRRLVAGIATQAAVAIENARLFEQAEQRTRELSTLLDVSNKVASTLTLEPLLELILDQVQAVAPNDRSAFMLLEDGELVVRAVASGPGLVDGDIRQQIGLRFPAASSPLWNSMAGGRVVIAPDVRADTPDAKAYQAAVGDAFNTVFANIHGWMGVPVMSKDRAIGMLAISSEQSDFYRPRHGELARAIASQAAVAVENARLFEEAQRRTSELSALLSVSQRVAAKLELGPLISALLEELRTAIDYNAASILTRDRDEIVILDVLNDVDGTVAPRTGMRFRAEGAIWDAMERRESVVIGDVRSDERWARLFRGAVGPLFETSFAHVRAWVSAPLVAQDRVIGALTISNAEPAYFTPDRLRLIQGIANQAAVAMENARLFEETQQNAREMSALLTVSQSVGAKLELGPLLTVLREQISTVVNIYGMSVLTREDDQLVLLDAANAAGGSVDSPRTDIRFPASGPIWDEMEAGRSIIITDIGDPEDAWSADFHATVGDLILNPRFSGTRAWIALPMTAQDRVIGMLTVSSEEPGFFTAPRERILRGIANQVAVALENAQLFEETQQRTNELSTLLDVSHDVASTLDRTQLVGLILDQLKKVIDYTGSSVSLFVGEDLIEIIESRPTLGNDTRGMRIPATRGPILWERALSLQTVIIPDIRDPEDPYARDYLASIGDAITLPAFNKIRSWMGIPLAPKDQAIGLLSMSRTEPNYFTERHARLARAIADQAAIALDNARLFEETQQSARELGALLDVTRGVASTLDLKALAGLVLDQLRTVVDYTNATLSIVDGGLLKMLENRGPIPAWWLSRIRVSMDVPAQIREGAADPSMIDSPAGQTLRAESAIIPDVWDDTPAAHIFQAAARRSAEAAGVDLEPIRWAHAYMGIPIVTKGRLVGLLSLQHEQAGVYTAQHERLARAVADQAAIAIENARLFEETKRRARETVALFRADEELFKTLNIDSVFQALVDVMVDVLEVDKCMVSTIDDDAGRYTVRASRNLAPSSIELMMRIRRRRPRRELGTISGPIINVDAVAALPDMTPVFLAEGIKSTMDIPIQSATGMRAVFSCAYTRTHEYTLDEQRLYSALAERAAVALDNAELYERSQQVASLEERQRLARELHDSVSQALYGIALGARTARTLLDRDPSKAIAPVDYVLQLAEAGLAEMRALIFELRPESLETEGLVAAIGKHVAATQARYGIEVASDMCPEPDAPIDVKEAIYRIAQEALHNVVKHAHASHVDVRLTCDDDELVVVVKDDGSGFDPDGDFPGHIGLRSMRERAANAGGNVSVTSATGEGTTVTGRIGLPGEHSRIPHI